MLHENITKLVLVLGALSLSASLSGCSGSTDPEPPPASATGSYLFYSGSINAVDPATPASPITVEAGTDVVPQLIESVFAGTYDAATKTINKLHEHAIVYAKTNGKLYKVSALKSSGTPTPTQLSSEAAADKICGGWDDFSEDFANPDNTQIVYRTPGADTTCFNSNDVYKMVRLGMSAADAPVTAKAPIAVLHNWSTGALSGWLVNDAGALKRCDVNFANCGASLKSITSAAFMEDSVGLWSNRQILNIDGALYVYDGDANTLSMGLHTLSGITPFVLEISSDASKFYFLTSNERKSIYVAPVDGSAAATVLVTDAADIDFFALSANKLVYTTATAIKAVAKTGGTATPLVTGNFVSSTADSMVVSGNHVYYTGYSSTGAPTAGVIDDDASNKSETINATWVGWVLGTSLSIDGTFYNLFQTIIRAEGYDAQGVDTGFAGGTLRSFNAASKAEVAVLGAVPTGIVEIDCFGIGANLLCEGRDSTPQPDIFFLNAATPNSLVRVTNTPTKSEETL